VELRTKTTLTGLSKKAEGLVQKGAERLVQKVERQRRLPILAQGFQPWDHGCSHESTLKELANSFGVKHSEKRLFPRVEATLG
jgi:hypothetical protein